MEEIMKKTLALLLFICMAGMAVAQDKMADQLRKAIVEEEANQNLDKAIAAYNDILKQYDDHRITAATALFHLADCYRKQDKKEPAIEAYQRIVREFPEQTKLASASRNYLASVYDILLRQDIEADREDVARRQEEDRRLVEAIKQAEIEAANKKLNIILQQIDIKALQIRDTEKRVEAGVVSSAELYPLRTELLSLQEQLADIQHRLKLLKIQN
jgi:tetratricopeptide (TPR) repeat protein